MTLSQKMIVISGAAVALIASAAACVIDSPNLEEKDVFKCESNDDCLDNSECVKTGNNSIGNCVPSSEVKRCVDNDKDGYEWAPPEYVALCGFSEEHPIDCDDNDALVYPGAPEICDGKNNGCDGCEKDEYKKDGVCTKWSAPCFGYSDEPVGVCKDAGLIACIDGKESRGACEPEDKVGYVDNERGIANFCDGLDNDCDGYVDDEAYPSDPWCKHEVVCSEAVVSKPKCVLVIDEFNKMSVETLTEEESKGALSSYNGSCMNPNTFERLGEDKCPCKGITACDTVDGKEVVVCQSGIDGAGILSESAAFLTKPETEEDGIDWNCNGIIGN